MCLVNLYCLVFLLGHLWSGGPGGLKKIYKKGVQVARKKLFKKGAQVVGKKKYNKGAQVV